MIVLGCDVGASTGIALLDCTGARPRFVSCEVVREDLTATVSALFMHHPIAAVGIETPAQVFEHGRAKDNEGARRSIERALLVARDAAGVVRATTQIQGRGAKVHDGQAHNIRRAVLGKLPKQHVDRFIALRLPLLIEGWPARSNNHERDAAIVALWTWQRERAGESTMPRVGKSMDRKATLRRMRGETQVYHAAEGQKAASSAARSKAEAAFAKVTGKQGERPCATTSTATSARTPGNARYATGAATTAKPRAPSSATSTSARTAAAPASARAAEAGSEDASPRMLIRCPVHNVEPGIVCPGSKNGACAQRARLAGLASAGARVLGPKPATGPKKKARAAVILAGVPLSAHDPACCAHAQAAKGEPVTCCNCPAGCPEQAAMRAQARSVACAVCGAGYVDGPPCVNVPEAVRCPTCGTNWGAFAEGRCMVCLDCPGNVRLERYAPPFEYGVHASRARAAGLPPFPCVADLDAGAKPVPMKKPPCPECDAGSCPKCRGVAWTWLPGRSAEVWLVLPWNVKECGACRGRGDDDKSIALRATPCEACNGTGSKPLYTRETRMTDPPPKRIPFNPPAEHQAAFGLRVVLTRTTITTRAGRLAWLFTMKDETRTT